MLEILLQQKLCTKCKKVKPLSEFYKQKQGKYGTRATCKVCTNKEKMDWYRANVDRTNATTRIWRSKNPEKVKTNAKNARRKLKEDIMAVYGGECACCGEKKLEFLAIDHINGGGTKHRASLGNKRGMAFYRYLKDNGYPSGYRVLCHNCNMSLGLHGYCPHNKERI